MAEETEQEGTESLRARAERAERALADTLHERNALWAQLQTRVAQERELEYTRKALLNVESSASWRLTAPLRKVKRLGGLRGAFKALRRR